MDHRRVRTSRLPPLSRREKPCLRAGGCWGGFAGGELFRVGRYVSTGARELVRDIERKMRHCVRRREKSFSSFLFRFRGNCGKVSPGGSAARSRAWAQSSSLSEHARGRVNVQILECHVCHVVVPGLTEEWQRGCCSRASRSRRRRPSGRGAREGIRNILVRLLRMKWGG